MLIRGDGKQEEVSDGAAGESVGSAKRGWTLMNNPEGTRDVEDTKAALPPIHSRSIKK